MRLIALCVCLMAASTAAAQSPRPDTPVEPDRPDLTNSAHLVGPGILQLEMGALFTRESADHHAVGSPVTARIGVRRWFEARISFDGVLTETEANRSVTGVGNVQLGAKLRILADADGIGLVSILPQVNLPTASAEKGLGSGEPDYTVTVATGVDLGPRAHVDVNYGVGAIGAGAGAPHFLQHVASASVSFAMTGRWNPYVEVFSLSRQQPDGSAVTAINAGAVYTIGTHMAIDGGVQFDLGDDTPGFAAFGGVSVALGRLRPSATRARLGSSIASPSMR